MKEKNTASGNGDPIERFFNDNKGLLPASVERLIKEIIGEYANGDSVLLQKSELKQAFSAVIQEGGLEGPDSASVKQRIIDAVEQVQAASSLSEKAVVDLLNLFEEMRTLVEAVDQDDLRKELNQKISAALEMCTFEDIAAQHMGKALNLLKQSCQGGEASASSDDGGLMSGPALPGSEAMSQEEIDKLLDG